MKKLDWYILKKFLGTFFFIMGIIMTIAVIFDVSEKIDDFLKNDAPLINILRDYYLNFILYYANLFSALLIFISVIFFTAKLAQNTEIVAILSSGISFKRMLIPYFIGATILTGISLYFNHYLIPQANIVRLDFEENYIRNPYYNLERNIHKQKGPEEHMYFERYDNTNNRGYKFTVEKWNEGKMTEKLHAQRAEWDSVKNKWTLHGYVSRKIEGYEEIISEGLKMDTVLNLHPDEFNERINHVSAMTSPELEAYIAQEKMEGSSYIPFYEIELYQRSSYPFATYILTLIGVAIASRKVRGGIGLHIALGMFICTIYILCMKVTTVFSTNAGLSALYAVWIPNLLFGVLAVYALLKAPK